MIFRKRPLCVVHSVIIESSEFRFRSAPRASPSRFLKREGNREAIYRKYPLSFRLVPKIKKRDDSAVQQSAPRVQSLIIVQSHRFSQRLRVSSIVNSCIIFPMTHELEFLSIYRPRPVLREASHQVLHVLLLRHFRQSAYEDKCDASRNANEKRDARA
jgi:hypothetical protein